MWVYINKTVLQSFHQILKVVFRYTARIQNNRSTGLVFRRNVNDVISFMLKVSTTSGSYVRYHRTWLWLLNMYGGAITLVIADLSKVCTYYIPRSVWTYVALVSYSLSIKQLGCMESGDQTLTWSSQLVLSGNHWNLLMGLPRWETELSPSLRIDGASPNLTQLPLNNRTKLSCFWGNGQIHEIQRAVRIHTRGFWPCKYSKNWRFACSWSGR